jgi:hypothetical protein
MVIPLEQEKPFAGADQCQDADTREPSVPLLRRTKKAMSILSEGARLFLPSLPCGWRRGNVSALRGQARRTRVL